MQMHKLILQFLDISACVFQTCDVRILPRLIAANAQDIHNLRDHCELMMWWSASFLSPGLTQFTGEIRGQVAKCLPACIHVLACGRQRTSPTQHVQYLPSPTSTHQFGQGFPTRKFFGMSHSSSDMKSESSICPPFLTLHGI
jgi:hypothetical protein